MTDSRLTILSLYPRQLGINGDSGNVLALVTRAAWRGVTAEVVTHDVGDALPDSVDIIHIGSGPRTAQLAVRDDLASIAPRLREWKAAGVPVLAVAGGWQLLGSSLTTEAGVVEPGAGLFASSCVLTSKRAVGEIVLDTADGRVAGFENHGAVVTLEAGARPLGTVVSGFGNGGAGDSRAASTVEGVVEGASIGTSLHGPFLPMNPGFADRMLDAALGSASAGDVAGSRRESVDAAAANARAAIAQRLGL